MRLFFHLALLNAFLLISLTGFSQDKVKAATIAFYNVENLFDTIDDPLTNDIEFTPMGLNRWGSLRYYAKLNSLASVIFSIGNEVVPGGPTLIGLSEIENRVVLEDLINTPPLKGQGYQIVHYDSPDFRGVDVGLLYKSPAFKLTNSASHRLTLPWNPTWTSRDQLVVSGELDGEMLHVVVNHWPSRAAGPEYRAEAAKLTRHITDSLIAIDRDAKIFIMGDLNDDPIDPSVNKILGANGNRNKVKRSELFNPMYDMYRKGIGSLAYQDAWNLFDQIIISEGVLNGAGNGWKYFNSKVYNPTHLCQPQGQYAGYPFRTFAGGAYAGGYSDHFPVYLFIVKR